MQEWQIIPKPNWLDTEAQVIEAMDYLLANGKEGVGYDTETTGTNIMEDYPLLLSFSDGKERFACEATWLDHALVQNLLTHKEIPKIGSNIKFDMHMTANRGIILDGPMYETIVMDWLIDENRRGRHGLKVLAKEYCGIQMREFTEVFPMIRKRKGIPDDTAGDAIRRKMATPEGKREAIEYSGLDAYATVKVKEFLEKLLKQEMMFPKCSLWDYYKEIEVPFTRVLWQIERRGFTICVGYLKDLEEPMFRDILNIEDEFNKAAGKVINLSSPPQLREFFYGVLKKTPTKFTPGGASGIKQPSTDEEVLDEWAEQGDEYAKIILRHRKISKMLKTYVLGLQRHVDKTCRIHCSLNQGGTVTGRLSSSDPNLQNIPRPLTDKYGLRKCFVAMPGEVLIAADYDQLEMKLMAHRSKDPKMIEAITSGLDLHCVPLWSEVLTKNGWVNLRDISIGTDIMTYTPAGYLTYSPVRNVIKKDREDVFKFKSKHVEIFTTAKHRNVVLHNKKKKIKLTEELLGKRADIIHNGLRIGGELEFRATAKLIGFCIGDGTRDTCNWKISVKLPRKINYLNTINEKKGGLTVYKNGDYTVFKLSPEESKYIDRFINKDKTLNWAPFLNMDQIAMCDVIEGWNASDGCDRGKGIFDTHSVIKDNLQLLQTLYHLTGGVCRFNKTESNVNSTFPSDKPLYKAHSSRLLNTFSVTSSKEPVLNEEVGCVSVDSGMFLIRQRDTVFVTGNCYTVSLMFDIPYAKVKEAKGAEHPTPEQQMLKEYRQMAKNIGFGLIYGIGPQKLSHDLTNDFGREVSVDDAKLLIRKYFNVFKRVEAYIKEQKAICRRDKQVQSLLGRIRRLPAINSINTGDRAEAERQSVNEIQADAADIAKIAMLAIERDEELKELGYRQILQIHDEIIGEVKDEPERVAKVMKRKKYLMEQSFNDNVFELAVPLTVACQSALTWAAAK